MTNLILAPLLFLATAAHADENYNQLIKLLGNTKQIGGCQLSLASRSESSYELGVTKNSKTIGFYLNTPDRTGGRTVVKFNPATKTYTYSQSDIAGWVNLIVTLDGDNAPSALKMTKTFGDGRIYDTGAECP